MDELVLTGARVAVAAPEDGARLPRPSSEPVSVHLRDGMIVAVGPDAGIGAGPTVERLDLAGRVVLPGLWDAHVHVGEWALARHQLDVTGAASPQAAAELVVARLGGGFDGDVLVGFGFREGAWAEPPDALMLDAATARAGRPGIPVAILGKDLHSAWLSTSALQHFGVTGHPRGVLREADWWGPGEVRSVVANAASDSWVDEAADAAAARGVVGVVDFEVADNVTAWRRRIAGGTQALRVVASIWPGGLEQSVAALLRTGDVVHGTNGLLQVGSLKVAFDGALNTRTAYCEDPYPGLTGPDDHGVLSVPPEKLEPLFGRAHRNGFTGAVHAVGDAAVALTLDAFEAVGVRGSVEHAQLVDLDDVRRFAALRVSASVQPETAMDDRDVADLYWDGRTDRAYAYRSLIDGGARVTFGSDAPLSPLDPWCAIAAAVTRARDGRPAWHPEQALDVGQALACSVRSRVAAGEVADLVILDDDPWTTTDLRTMPVAGTLLGGRWTWRT